MFRRSIDFLTTARLIVILTIVGATSAVASMMASEMDGAEPMMSMEAENEVVAMEQPGQTAATPLRVSKGKAKANWEGMEDYIEDPKLALLNDPFIPPSSIEKKLADRLEGNSPDGKQIPLSEFGLETEEDYWIFREQLLIERLGELNKLQREAHSTRSRLINVHAYNPRVAVDKSRQPATAHIKFQFRNESLEPISEVQIRLALHFDEATFSVLSFVRTIVLKEPIYPGERQLVSQDISRILQKSLESNDLKTANQIYPELRLKNYKSPDGDWQVEEFSRNQQQDLRKTQNYLSLVRTALGKQNSLTNEAVIMMD